MLEALANPHRREIVYVLGLQPCAVSQLARIRGLSLPAIHKHIKVLENAGLVSRRKTGRTTYLILNLRRLRLLQDWAGQFHTYWGSDEASFENYQSYLGIDPPVHHLAQQPRLRRTPTPHRRPGKRSLMRLRPARPARQKQLGNAALWR